MSRSPIVNQLSDVDAFFRELSKQPGFEVYGDDLPVAADAEIAAVEEVLGYPIPSEIRALWTSGVKVWQGTFQHDSFVSFGRDLCGPDIALRDLPTLRERADDPLSADAPEETREFVRLAKEGFPISFENPILVSDSGGAIYLMNFGDVAATRLAASLSEHLADWLRAGGLVQIDDEEGYRAFMSKVAATLTAWARGGGASKWLEYYRQTYWS